MDNEQIYKMFAKYFSGESSSEEIKTINDWINESSGNRIFYEEAKVVWENTFPEKKIFDVDKAWENVRNKSMFSEIAVHKFKKQKTSIRYFSYLKIAAAVVIMLGVSYFFYNQFYEVESGGIIPTKQIVAGKNEIKKIRLEEGTIVILNSESVLEFQEEFAEHERTVSLVGEAYFEVAHNLQKPFIVNAQNTAIKVLGTKFNVTAWQESNEVIVAVADGEVSFNNNSTASGEPVFINKDEMSVISKNSKPNKPLKVDVEKYYLFWLHNELNFYNASFKNIIHRLEMKYGVNISVNDISILEKHLTANFKDEPIDEILNIISIALDLKYSIDNNFIVFRYDN